MKKTLGKTRARRYDTKVTLGMAAAASGVSPSTVSRILNGTAVVTTRAAAVGGAVTVPGTGYESAFKRTGALNTGSPCV